MTAWFTTAAIVLILELFTGTIYLLVISAAIAGAGIVFGLTGNTFAAVFTVSLLSALGIWLVFRHTASRKNTHGETHDLDAGQTVEVRKHIHGDRYEVFYRGTQWQAQNTAETVLAEGSLAQIVAKNGNLLLIRPF